MLVDRLAKREIIQLEQDILERQKMLGMAPNSGMMIINSTSIAYSQFMVSDWTDFGDAYAIWRGKHVQFEMKSNKVTIGRASSSSEVDFDLLLEGTSYRISRKQVLMKICLFLMLTVPAGYHGDK